MRGTLPEIIPIIPQTRTKIYILKRVDHAPISRLQDEKTAEKAIPLRRCVIYSVVLVSSPIADAPSRSARNGSNAHFLRERGRDTPSISSMSSSRRCSAASMDIPISRLPSRFADARLIAHPSPDQPTAVTTPAADQRRVSRRSSPQRVLAHR